MKPQLEHYYGYPVEGVLTSEEDWQWVIVLQGGATITNLDKRRTSVPEITGLPFVASEVQEDQTILNFSGAPVTMTTALMELDAPGYEEDEEDALPPDPSPDRVADGPTGEPDGDEEKT